MDAMTQTVACSVCLNDIPISEESSAEARDYIANFCGLDCYAVWRGQGDLRESESGIGTAD